MMTQPEDRFILPRVDVKTMFPGSRVRFDSGTGLTADIGFGDPCNACGRPVVSGDLVSVILLRNNAGYWEHNTVGTGCPGPRADRCLAIGPDGLLCTRPEGHEYFHRDDALTWGHDR